MLAMREDELRRRFRGARRDPDLTVLEGFHALKHALRFGAEVESAVGTDPAELEALAADLAPDLAGRWEAAVGTVDAEMLAGLVPQAPRTGVVAIARRKRADVAAALADRREAPVVLLEQPRNMGNLRACGRGAAAAPFADRREAPVVLLEQPRNRGNLGACVRVAAAADAAGLLTISENDPWHPDAVRGAAGLHYALPAVVAVERAPRGERRPLFALDPEGEE